MVYNDVQERAEEKGNFEDLFYQSILTYLYTTTASPQHTPPLSYFILRILPLTLSTRSWTSLMVAH
ncbi:hypothetical protein EON63_12240 [archaeon]|nr:MAG: hypothetical protein EON63_12240 [archaeon]